jgi:hypothetical protein
MISNIFLYNKVTEFTDTIYMKFYSDYNHRVT